jgi:hypothetical protein
MIFQDAPAQVADEGVGGTTGQASSLLQYATGEARVGYSRPHPGEPPVDLILWHLAEAFGS